jgi:hypothetical protein
MTLRLHPEDWAGGLVSYLAGKRIRYHLTFVRRVTSTSSSSCFSRVSTGHVETDSHRN